jgi:hypothetical protein
MASSDITEWNDDDRGPLVAARFGSVAEARAAIEALQSAGVDGADVALLSPFPDRRRPTATADRNMARYLIRRVLLGVLIGGAVGIVVGALVGGVVVAVTAPAAALGELVAFVAVGVVIAAPLGAYIGFERAGSLSDAWSTTFDELEPGAIWVGVTIHAAHDQLRARRVLERQGPIETREL